jgi:hypothetical protein
MLNTVTGIDHKHWSVSSLFHPNRFANVCRRQRGRSKLPISVTSHLYADAKRRVAVKDDPDEQANDDIDHHLVIRVMGITKLQDITVVIVFLLIRVDIAN